MAAQSGDRITSASAQIQATAKWIIAAFAGVGAALIGGLQLTGLGKLDSGELAIAVGGLFLALAAVFVAVWVVSKVLTPPMILLGELDEYVGELTQKDVTLLKGQADDLATLLQRYEQVDRETRLRWEDVDQAKADGDAEAAAAAERLAEEKDEQFGPLDDAIGFLRSLALNQKVRKSFTGIWLPLALAVGAATAGVVTLAYMTNRPEDAALPPHASRAVGQTPVGVRVELSADEKKLLAPRLGKSCPSGALWGLAIGGRPLALDVVTFPTSRCRSVRVVVTPQAGIVIHRSPRPRIVRAEHLGRASE
jgi:hypothetical protein